MESAPEDPSPGAAPPAQKLAEPGRGVQPRRRTMLRRALMPMLFVLAIPSAFFAAFEDPDVAVDVAPPALPSQAPAQAAPAQAVKSAEGRAAAEPAPEAPGPSTPCGEGMVLVEGDYCTEVEHECIRWLDDPKLPFARCGDYGSAKCVGERRPMRFCIDRREYTPPGESLPQNYASYQIASRTCKSLGKRLCGEAEWTFACEGEEMRPYPYGFAREPVCNYDRSDLYETNKKKQVLKDLRAPSGSHPECVSPFGVYDMAGNVDEPTRRDSGATERFHNALKGGWWMAARNRCRPATTAHDDYYKDIQIGVRCCADAPPAGDGPKG